MVELLSVDDVARITGLSAYTIRAAVRAGQLEACKLRGRIRVHPDALSTWIDENRVRPIDTAGARPVPIAKPRRSLPPGGVREALRHMRGAG